MHDHESPARCEYQSVKEGCGRAADDKTDDKFLATTKLGGVGVFPKYGCKMTDERRWGDGRVAKILDLGGAPHQSTNQPKQTKESRFENEAGGRTAGAPSERKANNGIRKAERATPPSGRPRSALVPF